MKCICCESEQIISQTISFKEYYECSYCGFMFTEKNTNNNTRSTLVNHYQAIDPHERVAASKLSFFKSTLDHLKAESKNENKSILDVGCGFGYFIEFASRDGWNTFGVEISDIAVKEAKKKVGEKNIFHGFLRDANYPDGFFDAITAWDVLFIVDDPLQEVKECYRILKSGGKIGIRARNVIFQRLIYSLYQPIKNLASRFGVRNPYVFHRYCFTSKSMYSLLSRAGFKHIKISNSPLTKGDPYSHAKMSLLTILTKALIELSARVIFSLTRGRYIVGPSLLVWAEKPRP